MLYIIWYYVEGKNMKNTKQKKFNTHPELDLRLKNDSKRRS